MKYESIAHMHWRRHADKAAGVKRGPLHTLQECCEAVDITPAWFGRLAAKHPGAPQPILTAVSPQRKYYRKADVIKWINELREQQKAPLQGTTTMPDLQSELSKVINDWTEPKVTTEEPQMRHKFSESKGTSRALAEYIMNNPGKTRAELCDIFVAGGHHRPTVSALLGQMARQRRTTEIGGRVVANYTEYTPLHSHQAWLNIEKKAKAKAARERAKAAKEEVKVEQVSPAPVAPPADTEAFVNALTLKQAKAVYEELRKVFG